jgi:2-aminoethylphosphonate-pyruvate transaminase
VRVRRAAHVGGGVGRGALDLTLTGPCLRQWRYTPPVQVLAAFSAALQLHEAEGGVQGRGDRYRANCRVIRDGLTALGLHTYIAPAHQAPIILTFLSPRDPRYDFERLYNDVRELGYVLYPGKLTKVSTFRVGCVGAIAPAQMQAAVDAIRSTLQRHGVTDYAPA